MIEIKNITKKYSNNVILENTSYTFPQTGLVCLMGASGGGKTTLLNLLAGFDSDYEGEIIVASEKINIKTPEQLCDYRRDNIGFIFQNYHLLSGYTVLENILIATEKIDDNRKKAKILLTKLDIAEKEDEKIENLSGGQKQRVAIGRALINDPQIILADEPTGALDRTTSTEIMEHLKGISSSKLVIVITHDPKICEFADEVIHIKDKKIVSDKEKKNSLPNNITVAAKKHLPSDMFKRATKNMKVHFKKYMAVSLAISIGIFAFLFSLSFSNVMKKEIDDFKVKNTAFNNGYIRGVDDGTVLEFLNKDERIENSYYQYKLADTRLTMEGKSEIVAEKIPTAKAKESLSYGMMPRKDHNEIAISPSLAKKFLGNIDSLVGREISLKYGDKTYSLKVSGIYNAGYDDFIVSSDIERKLYETLDRQENYSISYDVKDFEDIVGVSNKLKLSGIETKDASEEVYALQNTFNSLKKLFLIISVLILAIGIFICTILLIKLQNSRYKEVGLLSALGFSKGTIKGMMVYENIMLSALAMIINIIITGLVVVVSSIIGLSFMISAMDFVMCSVVTFVLVMIISNMTSYKLINTEPAMALQN